MEKAQRKEPASTVRFSRSTVTSVPGSVSRIFHSCSQSSWETTPATSPCLPALPRKMSAKRGAKTTLKP